MVDCFDLPNRVGSGVVVDCFGNGVRFDILFGFDKNCYANFEIVGGKLLGGLQVVESGGRWRCSDCCSEVVGFCSSGSDNSDLFFVLDSFGIDCSDSC